MMGSGGSRNQTTVELLSVYRSARAHLESVQDALIASLPKREQTLLSWIRQQEKRITSQEVAVQMNTTTQDAGTLLKSLFDLDLLSRHRVSRVTGDGSEFEYWERR